jgi:hypothetical protein
MIPRRLATTAALCVLAAGNVWAQQMPTRPLPASNTAQQGATTPSNTLPQDKPEWSAHEIEMAQARCAILLKGLDVVAVHTAPWREGTECGTPAPMKLISIGKGQQQVMLSPPVDLTCDMIVAMHKWVQQDLQPLARKHLGGPLARIDTMSSYSCRNAYGRAKSRLSEHGRVNALDIRAFVAARGQTASVVADWGMTAREIAAQAKAGEATAQTKAAPATDNDSKDKQMATVGTPRAVDRPVVADPARIGIAIPGISIQMPGTRLPSDAGGIGLVQPSRLGGPKPQSGTEPNPAALNGKMDFLRQAHRSACKIFGTVLGPEANNAHKNHFHVDMADRRGIVICE